MRGDKLDREDILCKLRNDAELRISFREAAYKFQLIDEQAQAQVIVRYENHGLLSQLEHGGPERWLMRKTSACYR